MKQFLASVFPSEHNNLIKRDKGIGMYIIFLSIRKHSTTMQCSDPAKI